MCMFIFISCCKGTSNTILHSLIPCVCAMSYTAVNKSPVAFHCGLSTDITWVCVLFFVIQLHAADATRSGECVTNVVTYVPLLNRQLKVVIVVNRKHFSHCPTMVKKCLQFGAKSVDPQLRECKQKPQNFHLSL